MVDILHVLNRAQYVSLHSLRYLLGQTCPFPVTQPPLNISSEIMFVKCFGKWWSGLNPAWVIMFLILYLKTEPFLSFTRLPLRDLKTNGEIFLFLVRFKKWNFLFEICFRTWTALYPGMCLVFFYLCPYALGIPSVTVRLPSHAQTRPFLNICKTFSDPTVYSRWFLFVPLKHWLTCTHVWVHCKLLRAETISGIFIPSQQCLTLGFTSVWWME